MTLTDNGTQTTSTLVAMVSFSLSLENNRSALISTRYPVLMVRIFNVK